MADRTLPRPLQVVIWAVSTPTKTSKYPLAQNFKLFRMVPLAFAADVVKKARARSLWLHEVVAVGRGGGGAVRGLFLDMYAHFFAMIILFDVL